MLSVQTDLTNILIVSGTAIVRLMKYTTPVRGYIDVDSSGRFRIRAYIGFESLYAAEPLIDLIDFAHGTSLSMRTKTRRGVGHGTH